MTPELSEAVWAAYEATYTDIYPRTKEEVLKYFDECGYADAERIPRFMARVRRTFWYDGSEEHRYKPVAYMNGYHTEQMYGGPEEGGWYYQAGTPYGSIPFRIDRTEDELAELVLDLKRAADMLGIQDPNIFVELDYAYPYPEKRPHYE